MNCPFDKEKLSGYYDGELDTAEKAEVERHIASCSECLRELGELKSAALLVKELPRLRAPRSVAEGVKREIQAAGKVHRFAAVRRNLMWAAAVAAVLLVVVNVAYFGMNTAKDAESPMASQARPTSVLAETAAPRPPASRDAVEEMKRFDESVERRAADRAAGQRPAESELRKNLSEGKGESFGRAERGEKDALKSAAPAEKAKTESAPVRSPERPFAAAPPGAPAAKPVPAPAPVVAAKEEPRPLAAAADKAPEAKKDAEGLAKSDADMKSRKVGAADAAADAPAHLTLASTQMAKSRTQVEETLRKLGVAFQAPSQPVRGGANTKAPATAPENAYTLELTDAQLAKLREEIAKQGYSRLLSAAPGDPVLQQYGDSGLFRGREKSAAAASGGAAAPPPPAPTAKKSKDDVKELEDPQAGAKPSANKQETAGEPRRKVVLHLLEVLAFPDPQPAGDPVKK